MTIFSLDQEWTQVTRKIAKISSHPSYNKTTYDYDYSVFELEEPISFNDRVEPVCLPDSEDSQQERHLSHL